MDMKALAGYFEFLFGAEWDDCRRGDSPENMNTRFS